MRFEINLALRYFRARRKSLARFTSLVAVVGIAAGVASLILASSLARGFADEMQNKILANTAHISVSSNDGAEIFNWQQIKSNLENLENVKSVSATAYESAVVIGKQTTNYAVLQVNENRQPSTVNRQMLKTSEQRTANSEQVLEISVGKELAERADLKAGDAAEIITIENESAPKTSKVFVREIFQTGLYEYDSIWIRISPENYARLKNQSNFTPTVLSVCVKDIYTADVT
ncbi:MAG: ABC transporter permease, partial [Pyrinomonadaceae bacterium]